jgi:hypothetical protein
MKIVGCSIRYVELGGGKEWWEHRSIAFRKRYIAKHPKGKHTIQIKKSILDDIKQKTLKQDAKQSEQVTLEKSVPEIIPAEETVKPQDKADTTNVIPDKGKGVGKWGLVKSAIRESAKQAVSPITKEIGDAKLAGRALNKIANGQEVTDEELDAQKKIMRHVGIGVMGTLGTIAAFAVLGPFTLVLSDAYLDYKNTDGGKTEEEENYYKKGEKGELIPITPPTDGAKPKGFMLEKGKRVVTKFPVQWVYPGGSSGEGQESTEDVIKRGKKGKGKSLETQVADTSEDMAEWIKSQDPKKMAEMLAKKHPELADKAGKTVKPEHKKKAKKHGKKHKHHA